MEPTSPQQPVLILPAEYVGEAACPDGLLRIGVAVEGNTGTNWRSPGLVEVPAWCKSVSVYVRRLSTDLTVAEIHMARHDGLDHEESEQQNIEAERYPLGPKEYWRSEMVGHYTYGIDGHIMTDEEFEQDWSEE